MFNVKCPQCKRICHKTTETYNPDIRPDGSMVELLDPWKTWGWGKFGDNRIGGATVLASGMQCPLCQAPLAPSGRLIVVPLNEEALPEIEEAPPETNGDTIQNDLIECPICKKVCKSKLGLHSHMRSHEAR